MMIMMIGKIGVDTVVVVVVVLIGTPMVMTPSRTIIVLVNIAVGGMK
jgi:hypothetical protein